MGNFNAGAIEASLALGRSGWTKDLKRTKAEIAELEKKSITIGVDIDDDNARIAMDNLELMLDDLDDSTYKPSIDIDTEDVNATLDRLDERLDALDDRRVIAQIFADTDNAEVSLDNLERNLDTLDRDPVSIAIEIVTAEANTILAELEARLDALRTNKITVEVDADTDNAMVAFSLLEDEMNLLETDGVTIDVDVNAADAQAELVELAQFQQMMTLAGIDIDVDVPGYASAVAKMATLEAQAAVLNGTDIDIDVDVDRDMLTGLVGSAGEAGGGGGGYLGLLKILLYAIIALMPILAAATSAATFALVAFAAAVVGAAGPLAVLVAGIVGLIARFKQAQESGEKLSGPMQAFADALDAVKDGWSGFLDAIEDTGFDVMAQALGLVADILPDLAPIFNETAEMIGRVLDSIKEWMNSSEYKEMLDFFQGFGIDMLETFIRIGGNLIQFFGRLFDAIAPFAEQMMQGLDDVTAGWAEWADNLATNDAFIEWVENAMEYGPMVLDLLGSIVMAFMNIGRSLEPFAGPMLSGLTSFFDLIANMDPDLLGPLIAGMAGLYLGTTILLPALEGLIGLFSGFGAVLAVAFSPLGAIILGIAAIAATIVYLWKTNEEFRDNIIDAWADIRDTVGPIIQDFVDLIRENWGPISEWLDGIAGDWVSIVKDNITSLIQVVRGILAVIGFIWEHWGEDIIRIVKGVAQIVGGIIRGLFQVLSGIFKVIRSVLTGDWRGMWEGLKQIGRGFVTAFMGIIRGFGNLIAGTFNGINTAVRGIFNGTVNGIKGMISGLVEWARGQWAKFKGIFSVHINVGDIFSGIISAFRGAVNTIVNWWNGLSFSIPGFDPPGPGPKFDGFSFSPPNISGFAKGGYVTDPVLGMIGEGSDPEIIAPEPVLERIIRENSGAGMDYGKIGSAVAIALAPLLRGLGVSREDLERLIEAASVNLNIDVESEDGATVARKIANAVGFNLRTLGYGGKYA